MASTLELIVAAGGGGCFFVCLLGCVSASVPWSVSVKYIIKVDYMRAHTRTCKISMRRFRYVPRKTNRMAHTYTHRHTHAHAHTGDCEIVMQTYWMTSD